MADMHQEEAAARCWSITKQGLKELGRPFAYEYGKAIANQAPLPTGPTLLLLYGLAGAALTQMCSELDKEGW